MSALFCSRSIDDVEQERNSQVAEEDDIELQIDQRVVD